MPDISDVFGDTAGGQRFVGFCHLYFRITTALGGFQELGRMYFDIMRDSMFDSERGNKVNGLLRQYNHDKSLLFQSKQKDYAGV